MAYVPAKGKEEVKFRTIPQFALADGKIGFRAILVFFDAKENEATKPQVGVWEMSAT